MDSKGCTNRTQRDRKPWMGMRSAAGLVRYYQVRVTRNLEKPMPMNHPSFALIALLSLCPTSLSLCDTSIVNAESGHFETERKLPKADPVSVRVAIPADVELVADGLNFPNSVELDDNESIWLGLSGAGHGNPDASPAVLKVGEDGKRETVIEEGLVAPLNDLLWHDGTLFVSHRGKVSKWDGSSLKDVVTGWLSSGDHTNNQIVLGLVGSIDGDVAFHGVR